MCRKDHRRAERHHVVTTHHEGLEAGEGALAALLVVIGATAGVVSPTFPLLALLAGAIAGGVWGVVALIGGRRGYPYGPSLVMGPYLAMLALSWSGG